MGTGATDPEKFEVVVIGSGFGGAMTSLSVAAALEKTGKGKVRILERGTWWTTPVGTVKDPEVKTAKHLRETNLQPVQYWPAINHFRGALDIVLRCVRRRKNEDGLFDVTFFGRNGFLGIGRKSDGVSILRASGVGGGSLVYSNVTIRPPDFVLDAVDENGKRRWPEWLKRDRDFALARWAIGRGVLFAIGATPKGAPAKAAYDGLSQISTRSSGIDPEWRLREDPERPADRATRSIPEPKPPSPLRVTTDPANPKDPGHGLWIDRARVFQTAMASITDDFGTVQSSIADVGVDDRPGPGAGPTARGTKAYNVEWQRPAPLAPDPADAPPALPFNYCERQGRCNVGCLPGARFTLNKQFMVAMFGPPDAVPPHPGPLADHLSIEPLAEVDVVVPLEPKGYEIHYVVRDREKPWKTTPKVLHADRVVFAAGCVGTTEILLRSKLKGRDRKTLDGLSDTLGSRFSTNGDYLAFLERTKTNVNLVRGPATTSYAHFNTPAAGVGGIETKRFHTVEDQGVPPALASLVGIGVPFIRKIGNYRGPRIIFLWLIFWWTLKRAWAFIKAIFQLPYKRPDFFKPAEELTSHTMCIAAMGREASVGRFRLGKFGDSPLRVERDDGAAFIDDPIYDEIRGSLKKFADQIREPGTTNEFLNPFLTSAADALAAKSVTLTHALGGCPMGSSAADGAVDDRGRVFDKSKSGGTGVYEGLYVADASMIPTALGVNPSLTISALALNVARGMVKDITGAAPTW